ncbi:MAG: M20/M25/M40 family metallo-hydrolase [Gemmatimonadetes bacterium]|nr:M20/M25/M40 family metallo-hydrolase [Gemmatimonadota bacterium]
MPLAFRLGRRAVRTLALVLACATPAQAQNAKVYTPGQLTPAQAKAREIFKELVEINTSVTTGNVTNGAVAMAKRFREAGIPDSDIFVGGPRPDKHNVVARIRGKHPADRKPVLLLAHIDVVEALKADWSPEFDPFTFTEKDGYYYARGIADDKAMASIFVANLFRMKAEGYQPDRDIIVALTADEESGPANGVDWLVTNHPELVDAGIVINEGGGGVLRDGKPLFQGIQLAQKITMNFTLRATNRGGHSSVPRKDNAITSLADALSKVGRHEFPVQLNDVTREFFSKTAALEPPEMGRAMKALVANPADPKAAAIIAADDRYSSMLRTTCVATMLNGGHATNALPQLAEANINCRVYPTENAEQVRAALERVVSDTAVKVLIKTQRPSTPPSKLSPEIMEPVTRLTKELFGNVPIIPTMSTGANDSRFFLARGVPSYGVSGIFSDPRVDARAHGRDERIRMQSYYEGQEFLYRLTQLLASNPPAVP